MTIAEICPACIGHRDGAECAWCEGTGERADEVDDVRALIADPPDTRYRVEATRNFVSIDYADTEHHGIAITHFYRMIEHCRDAVITIYDARNLDYIARYVDKPKGQPSRMAWHF